MVGRGSELTSIVNRLRAGVGTVVVGEAGVGKTVLARDVQRQLGDEGWNTRFVLCGGRLDFPLYTVTESAGSAEPGLLVVDDAHLLDEDSAEVLWRLASTGTTQIVATLRAGEPVPDRVARLWTGGSCERLDLRPLAESDIRLLLEQVLGGEVEDRLPRLLVRRAAGNALLLRELIRSGIDSGAIVQSHGVWRLDGQLPAGDGVAQLVRAAVSGLSDQELRAAQLVAFGEPLRLTLASGLIAQNDLEALETKKILQVQDTADGLMLTVAHPLYGEVIRADVSPLRTRRLRLELLGVMKLDASSRPHDVMRAVLWRLELHEPTDSTELLRAAELARSSSAGAAESLARAAMKTDRRVDAMILLAEILLMQGRVTEADRLLDEVELTVLSGAQRERVTYGRALGRTRLGDAAEAAALITGAADHIDSRRLQGLSAQALMLDGRIDEAMAVARPLFTDESGDSVSRMFAALTLVAGCAYSGSFDDTDAIVQACLPLAETARAEIPQGLAGVMVTAVINKATEGNLEEAEKAAYEMYDRALGEDDEWMRPRGASGLGVVALLRGQPHTAMRYFRITVASLNDYDELYLRYNLSYLARALALAGLVEEARAALHAPAEAPRVPIFRADWEMAEAAVLAAEGNLAAAAGQALGAARTAASIGQWVQTMLVAHDAARYSGSPEAAELTSTAADRVRGPLPICLGEHARARAANDPVRLVRVSERFEAIGTILYAAEASYAAARAFRLEQDGHSSVRALVRATQLHAGCEQAFIPWIAGFQASSALTRREHQIALLAAAGHSDATIATDLGVSIRTVQTHLLRIYAKLGVSGRRELPDALAHDLPAT